MHAWDVAIFRIVNQGWANPFFDILMPGVSDLAKHVAGIVLLALAWLGVLLMLGKPGVRAALLVIPAVLIANELADLGKAHLGAMRPCVELPDARVLGEPLTSDGMPSAHSANMSAVATVLFGALGKRWWPVWFLPLFSGFSRIYIGVHYPSQVLVGWMMGAVVGLLLLAVFRPRGTGTRRCGHNGRGEEENRENLPEVP